MLFQVMATVVETTETGTITHQIPTFYLNSDVQGIVNCDHAAKIAEDILNPCKLEKLVPHINVSTVFENSPVGPSNAELAC